MLTFLDGVLTARRRETLVAILADLGQVAVASVALPFFLETPRPILSIAGFIIAVAFWYGALVFSK